MAVWVKLQGLDAKKMYKVKEINLMPNSKSSLAANEKTYSSDYLMKVGIDAFTTNQAFSRVIELTADNFLLPYSCQAFGTLVPRAWHSSANAVAQLCQRHGTNIKNKRGNTVRGESPFSYNKTIN